jgi:hypothetical protein
MENIVGYTGETGKGSSWPHPMNDDFNRIIRNVVSIYGIAPKEEAPLVKRCRDYLYSRIKGIIEHRIVRETEEYYRAMDLSFHHGFGKDEQERQNLLEESSIIMCAGAWDSNEDCLQQFRMATMLGKPVYEMSYRSEIPLNEIIRYLQPVRPIKDEKWDPSKQDDVLIYENTAGSLELIDGNHRHEFANRMGTVQHLSGWIVKEV